MFHARMPAWPILACLLAFHAASASPSSLPAASATSATLEGLYPGLSVGALSFASLADLPAGQLLEAGALRISQKDLDAEIAKAPESSSAVIKKNQIFLLEQMATQSILLDLARQSLSSKSDAATTAAAEQLLNLYLRNLTQAERVTDKEAAEFYEKNKEMCGGESLEKIKGQIKEHVLEQKRQKTVEEHIRTLGKRTPIRLSASWTKEHAALALDNPVDSARKSGLPSMVDFGAKGCRPCDMMAPILETLKKKYAGKANIVFVHVRENPFLASRYGVESIPEQVFFDKDGKEVFRHTGFYPQDEIEKKLAGINSTSEKPGIAPAAHPYDPTNGTIRPGDIYGGAGGKNKQ